MTPTPYLLTASGQRYRLTGPELDTPRIGDIAHHLAQINRFTGAASRPYSVAEHSLLCEHIAASEGAGPIGRMCALMHDAHEAYTADASSPAKQAMREIAETRRFEGAASDYAEFERIHSDNVRETFGLLDAFTQYADDIKRWDLIALATERRDLMPADDAEWEILQGVESAGKTIRVLNDPAFDRNDWKTYRGMFLLKFHELSIQILSSDMRAKIDNLKVKKPKHVVWCTKNPTTGEECGPFNASNDAPLKLALDQGLRVFTTYPL